MADSAELRGLTALAARAIGRVGGTALLLGQSTRALFRGDAGARQIAEQMGAIGLGTALAVLVTVMFSGAVGAYHTVQQMVRLGLTEFIGGAVAVSITREIAPVLTAVIVLARAGSAMTAEIGTMSVTEQLDALRAMGVSPVGYLVSPRLVGALVMLPILFVLSIYAGCAGGYAVASASGVGLADFVDSVARFATFRDVVGGLVKSAVFGVLIVLICCHLGLTARGGAAGVGRHTTLAVVATLMAIYIANYMLATLIW